MAADLVSVLHGGALPILLRQSRSNVTEKVLWQLELSELLQLANRLERVIEAHPPLDPFSIAERASIPTPLFRHLLSPH